MGRGSREEGLAAGTINGIYRTFSKILKTAVIDGLIPRSPCIGIDLPKQTSHEEMKFLDPDQVEALEEAIEPRFRALIYTVVYTGMRWGELAVLKVERLNPLRGTVDVVESMSEINGYLLPLRVSCGSIARRNSKRGSWWDAE